ncbi:unnamed protein product [marine sediment metagenome]|uniref:Uncharacterized protein n=1 Tax=marine sediment metagenome TaxID=412755 RepID=X0X1J5_9ZZZZ
MNHEDRKHFAFLMAQLETAFFESVSRETVALYVDYLNDLSINQIQRAVEYLIAKREKRGFPAIAEIRTATLGSTEYKAVKAWGELVVGTYDLDKKYKDDLISEVATVAFGSIGDFYAGDKRNEMADRAHFIRTYKLIVNLKEAREGRRQLRQKDMKKLEEK